MRSLGHGTEPSGPMPRVAFVSTYPPAICGLASFTESLRQGFAIGRGSNRGLDVVELVDDARSPHSDRAEVIAHLRPADPVSIRETASALTDHDVVILQHEYGVWGPNMGSGVIAFADSLRSVLITTLHTLLTEPSPLQEEIITGLVDRSTFTVVQTKSAASLLSSRYGVNPGVIAVIPHGTGRSLRSVARVRSSSLRLGGPRLLTWGLIGPGKGLEWSLQAVDLLRETYPDIVYTIAGRTHPKVLARAGETYREGLQTIVSQLHLEENVRFIDEYLTQEMLEHLLTETTLAVLPYDSTDQMVSGVLVESVSAAVPVVATSFPHALELEVIGAASTVPHRNPEALAEAIGRLLMSATSLQAMSSAQKHIASSLEWSNVARQYDRLISSAQPAKRARSHVPTAS